MALVYPCTVNASQPLEFLLKEYSLKREVLIIQVGKYVKLYIEYEHHFKIFEM